MNNIDVFAERLMAEMIRQGLSYGDLENATGISKSALHRYSHGDTKKVPYENVDKIAAALHVSAEYLIGWNTEAADVPASDKQLMLALFGSADGASAAMLADVREYAEFVKTKYNKK